MQALVYAKSNVSLKRNHPAPKASKGELLLKVLRASVCQTDLEIIKGYMQFEGVLGHEFVGEVIEGSPKWRGRRVVSEINCVCGQCDMCRSGVANHCRARSVMGIDGRDGCFAEMVVVPERNCHLIPDAITDDEAVFVEPLAAAYQTLHQVHVEPRMRVAVLGAGRLGLLMAQVLLPTKCDLMVISRSESKLSFCDKKGIRGTLLADLLAKTEYDLVIDCTGSPDGLDLAMKLTRPRGKIVLKTTTAAAGHTNMTPLVVNEIALLGSRCGPFPEAINALARKEIDVLSMISRTFPLSKAPAALDAAADPNTIKVLIDTTS